METVQELKIVIGAIKKTETKGILKMENIEQELQMQA